MKVQNITNSRGNKVPNQFEIHDDNYFYFQSYQSIIVKVNRNNGKVQLDRKFWNYSNTTRKYRNVFLGETTRDILRKIESGEYELTDLN